MNSETYSPSRIPPSRLPAILLVFAGLLTCLAVSGQTIIDKNTRIGAGDSSLDGRDLVINGATLTIDGAHVFNSLWITNKGRVTHPAATTNLLELTISGSVVIAADAALDVSGRGYESDTGPGPGAGSGGVQQYGTAGGAHGGGGGAGSGEFAGGAGYGSARAVTEPHEFGSGGGRCGLDLGGPGGGALRLAVGGTLHVDGVITANGNHGSNETFRANSGGGAGGSLWIQCETLEGPGSIVANGGNGRTRDGGYSGSGSGGRIAIYYTRSTFTGPLQAFAGEATNRGGAGTIYTAQKSQLGTLLISNGGSAGETTELAGELAFNANLLVGDGAILSPRSGETGYHLSFAGDVTIKTNGIISATGGGFESDTGPGYGRGSGALQQYGAAGGGHGGAGGDGSGGFAGGNGYALSNAVAQPTEFGSGGGRCGTVLGGSGGGSLQFTVGGTLRVDGIAAADGGEGENSEFRSNSGGGGGGSIWIECGTLGGAGRISVNGGGGRARDAGFSGGGGGGRVAIYHHTSSFTGQVQAFGGTATTRGGAGTIYMSQKGKLASLLISNGGTAGAATEFSGEHFLEADLVVGDEATISPVPGETGFHLHLTGDATVQADGAISATGLGFASDSGPGRGSGSSTGGQIGTGGGGHAGGGGSGSGGYGGGLGHGLPNAVTEPQELGSGGARCGGVLGGAGGGAIRLTVDGTFHLDGIIVADGIDGGNTEFRANSGAGAGGSIWISCGTIEGPGLISAIGGSGRSRDNGSSGGGGGGRIAIYYSVMDDAIRDTLQVRGGDGFQQGGGGTVYLAASTEPLGELVIDRSPLAKSTAPTYLDGDVVVPGVMRIRSGAILTQPQGHPLHLSVLGDLIIASGAKVLLDGCGYRAWTGHGAAQESGAGAGHGAPGGDGSNGNVAGRPYDIPEAPIEPGSGGWSQPGGGAVRLSVLGTLQVNGILSVNGVDSSDGGGSSGGSIYVRASRITGSGTISADGGDSNDAARFGGGAGGRIALHYHGDAFSATRVSAIGGKGWKPGGNGSIVSDLRPLTESPVIESVRGSPSLTEVGIVFSDVIDWRRAEVSSNYTLGGGLQVVSATLQPDLRTVLLGTTPQTGGTAYSVGVSGILNGLGVAVPGGTQTSFVAHATSHGALRESVYYGIPGSRLSDLYASPNWPATPDTVSELTRFVANRDDIDGEDLAVRLTGYLVPDETGWHTFFISSDDNGALYLSQDHDPANLRLIASEPRYGRAGDWTTSEISDIREWRGTPPANISTPVWLEAGHYYWFDARMKEGLGGEHLSVTWQAPGDDEPNPLEATRLKGDLLALPLSESGPQITAQPNNLAVNPGATVTLRAVAKGTSPLRYQWFFNGSPLAAATADTLVLNNITANQFGTYRLRVTDPLGSVDSRPAILSRALSDVLILVSQPNGIRVSLGADASFSVVAAGAGPLTYQWKLNGQDIVDATNSLLTVPAVQRGKAGNYTVVVINANGSIESDPALLSLDLPSIDMADRFTDRRLFMNTSGIGSTANAIATADSDEPGHADKPGGRSLWMTWRAAGTGVATFRTTGSSFDTLLAVYSGNSLSSLRPIASDEDSGGFLTSEVRFNATAGTDYQVAVDGFDGATGTVVLSWDLDVQKPLLPEILRQPASVLAIDGQPALLFVGSPTPGVTYQWFHNGQLIPNQTTAALSFASVGPANAGSYVVRLSTPAGAFLDSEPANLEVTGRRQTALALSTDKLADLFPLDEAGGSEVALQGVRLAAAAPPAVGLPGSQWTDNSGSSRSPSDPATCGVVTSASRWFRLRFAVSSSAAKPVKFTTVGSDIATLVAVFTNHLAPQFLACDVALPPLRPSAQVEIQVRRGVDYLVLVDGLAGARGRIKLNWDGEEEAPPSIRLLGNRFQVDMRVIPGIYDWQRTDAIGGWENLFRTNVASGVFQFADPNPPNAAALFFRLKPVP